MDHRVKPGGDERHALPRMALGDAINIVLYRAGVGVDEERDAVDFLKARICIWAYEMLF
jgi:hypothetical protein